MKENCNIDSGYYSDAVLTSVLENLRYSVTGAFHVSDFLELLPISADVIEKSFGFLHLHRDHWTAYRVLQKNGKWYLVHINSMNSSGPHPGYQVSEEGLSILRTKLANNTDALLWVYPRDQESEIQRSALFGSIRG